MKAIKSVLGWACVPLLCVGLAGCGSSTPKSRPSAAARIACSNEAVEDIASTLGLAAVKEPTGVWSAPVYSCRFAYSTGTMVLSVTDNADATAAHAAFVKGRPAGVDTVPALGQEAYSRADGSAVVRKDAQILVIDVSGLPTSFGTPPHPRNIDAIDVATAILACWTES